MPWTFDTPMQSDLVGETIPECKITKFTYEAGRINALRVYLEYGKTETDGSWTQLVTPVGKPTSIVLTGQDFVDYITANYATYGAVKASLYDLISPNDKNLVPAGSIT